MVYQVKESQGRLPINRFSFELDGVEYSVPKLEFLTGRALRLAAKLEEQDPEDVKIENITAIYDLVEVVAPEAKEALEDLEPNQVMELFNAWQGESEDPGKPDSSES